MAEVIKSDIKELLDYMPHRYPFLLIDRVITLKPGESIKVIKNTTMNEPFYQGHFSGNPVFPATLILESMAQAAGLLTFKSKNIAPREKLYVYAGVTKARFSSIVKPGDRIIFEVVLKNERRNVVFLSATAKVGNRLVCDAELTIIGVNEEDVLESIQHRSAEILDLPVIENDAMNSLEIEEVMRCLPQRYPYLLVDRVLSISKDLNHITALKSTTLNEPFYQGHFPEQPVFPGVILLEAMAQTAGILAAKHRDADNIGSPYFTCSGIDKAKFKLIVQPGDQIIFEVVQIKQEGEIGFYSAKALVDGNIVCTADLIIQALPLEIMNSAHTRIDSRAVIHPSAKIGKNVEIGPWTYIGPNVEIGDGTWIGPHVVVNGPTKLGKNNKIFQFASVGEASQDISCYSKITRLEIGDNNVIRECCTIHRGTTKDKGITKIGSNNLFMAYSHIAHDCVVGNKIIFSNNASLAGHVTVHDNATIGAFSAVHQFCVIGSYSFLARAAMVPQDVPPYINVIGGEAEPHGVNVVGLQRKGFSEETIRAIKEGYKILYRQGLTLEDAMVKLKELGKEHKEVLAYVEFIELSKRGIVR